MPKAENHDQSIADPAVVVRKVSKVFKEGFGGRNSPSNTVHALQSVSLVAKKGEAVGLLGQNGSGKSTLMKLIAGSEKPTSGEIFVAAVPTLLSVGAALVPNLTGRRNVELGCLAMGFERDEIEKLLPEIIEFADIGEAIDRPMRTYSSGMGARLRFAIGTCGTPELLLIDEALSTGDASFSAKAEERMRHMLERSGTLFLVSHAAMAIEKNCDRAIWLDHGNVVADGGAAQVCETYRRWVQLRTKGEFEAAEDLLEMSRSEYIRPEIVWSHTKPYGVAEGLDRA